MAKTISFMIFTSFFFLLEAHSIIAQKTMKETAADCENVRQSLYHALTTVDEEPDSIVIFVFRLGAGENSRRVIQRRMGTVRNFITFRSPKFNRYILVEGERVRGLGKLEIYVGGKLQTELHAKRNADFGYDCSREPF